MKQTVSTQTTTTTAIVVIRPGIVVLRQALGKI